MGALSNVKITQPVYDDIVPSTQKPVTLTPFRVGDEKSLMIASESKNTKQMLNALKEIIGNCVRGVNVSELESFDLEYLFVKLRAISVGESTDLLVTCDECEHQNKVTVDLMDAHVEGLGDKQNTFEVSNEIVFEMKYPTLDTLATVETEDFDSILTIIASSVKTVYYGQESYTIGKADVEDVKNIILQLQSKKLQELQAFFTDAPKLKLQIVFDCDKCEHHNELKVEGIANFF